MSFLTAIGTALGFVNSNQTASELAKDMASGLDMLVYTKEEKAIDAAKMTTDAVASWLSMLQLMKDSETYRSITRRILAVGIVLNLLGMIWICIIAELIVAAGFYPLATATAEGVTFTGVTWAIIKIAAVFQLGWVFATIIVFYFGPHLINQFRRGK